MGVDSRHREDTSPGRWPVNSKKPLRGEHGIKLAAECKRLYLDWILGVSKGSEKRLEEIFWSLAGGKSKASPFEEFMGGARNALDRVLVEMGMDPSRREGDRASEVNFRRLQAMLEAMIGLSEIAEEGVALCVDGELPESFTEEEFRDVTAENYKSAEESSADIKRQVLEEVELGLIAKMSGGGGDVQRAASGCSAGGHAQRIGIIGREDRA